MAAQPAVWGASWRNKAQAALALAVGVVALVVGAFFLYLYFHDSGQLAAYQSAGKCASAHDAVTGRSCRYEGPARVISTSRPVRLQVQVAFDALPGRTFTASFVVANEPDSTTVTVGETVDAELWNGEVTRIAGKPSDADPELATTTSYLIVAVILVVGSLVIFVLAIPLARAAWRQK